jgi:hypothetical protein
LAIARADPVVGAARGPRPLGHRTGVERRKLGQPSRELRPHSVACPPIAQAQVAQAQLAQAQVACGPVASGQVSRAQPIATIRPDRLVINLGLVSA